MIDPAWLTGPAIILLITGALIVVTAIMMVVWSRSMASDDAHDQDEQYASPLSRRSSGLAVGQGIQPGYVSLSARAAVLRHVHSWPGQRPREIAEALGIDYANVKQICRHLADAGQLRATGSRQYYPADSSRDNAAAAWNPNARSSPPPMADQSLRRPAAQRMIPGHLDNGDPHAVRISNPHLVQPPRLPPRLSQHRHAPVGQFAVGRRQVADLQPQRDRVTGRVLGSSGQLKEALPEEEHRAPSRPGPELPVDRQPEHVPVELPAALRVDRV